MVTQNILNILYFTYLISVTDTLREKEKFITRNDKIILLTFNILP